MNTFNIPASVMKAAALCAAQKPDARDYLNGVHVSKVFDGRLAVTGTDGHVLFRYLLQEKAPEDFPEDGVNIPLATIKAIRTTKKNQDMDVSVAVDGHESMLAFSADGSRFMFSPIPGKYANIASVFPAEVDAEKPFGLYVDPTLVKRAVDAMSFVGANWSYVYHDQSLFLSSKNEVAHAIIMSLRADKGYSRPRF